MHQPVHDPFKNPTVIHMSPSASASRVRWRTALGANAQHCKSESMHAQKTKTMRPGGGKQDVSSQKKTPNEILRAALQQHDTGSLSSQAPGSARTHRRAEFSWTYDCACVFVVRSVTDEFREKRSTGQQDLRTALLTARVAAHVERGWARRCLPSTRVLRYLACARAPPGPIAAIRLRGPAAHRGSLPGQACMCAQGWGRRPPGGLRAVRTHPQRCARVSGASGCRSRRGRAMMLGALPARRGLAAGPACGHDGGAAGRRARGPRCSSAWASARGRGRRRAPAPRRAPRGRRPRSRGARRRAAAAWGARGRTAGRRPCC
jgi:hypothetical protein